MTDPIGHWRSHASDHDRDELQQWALPLIVRVEKNPYTAEHLASIRAAAEASVRLLTDPRSAPEGEWFEPLSQWRAGRIRKVARRARGIRWAEASDASGVTAVVEGSEVRALLPHPVEATPASVKKMQVGGLDLPTETSNGPAPVGALQIVGAPGVEMTTGKACAQAAHAAQLAMEQLEENAVREWAERDFPVAVRGFGPSVDAALWQRLLSGQAPSAVVRDGGFTEVAPGTITCAAHF